MIKAKKFFDAFLLSKEAKLLRPAIARMEAGGGDPLKDKELDIAIQFYGMMTDMLFIAGPHYLTAAEHARGHLTMMKDWQSYRSKCEK